MRASVTVSMAAVISGVFRVMRLVSRVEMEISLGSTSDLAGISSTSSKVRPSLANFCSALQLTTFFPPSSSYSAGFDESENPTKKFIFHFTTAGNRKQVTNPKKNRRPGGGKW